MKKFISLITLNGERKPDGSTIFKDPNTGVVKAFFARHLKQPHKNKKTIVINCATYKINWI